MTQRQLDDIILFSFKEIPDDFDILEQIKIHDGATFIIVSLRYSDDTMTVPFVYYEDSDLLFTPCDWQGNLPTTPEEIENISWRVNDSKVEAFILNGLPRLFL